MTQSWIIAKTRLLLDKLDAAGAKARDYGATIKFEIEEYGGALKRELIKEVLPDGVELPSVLTPRMVHRAEIKWLVFGGVWGGAAVGGFSSEAPLVQLAPQPWRYPLVRSSARSITRVSTRVRRCALKQPRAHKVSGQARAECR